MSQHDMDISLQSFPDTRADLNLALKALASFSSGAAAPSTAYANQPWYDTTNHALKLRNEANTAWNTIVTVDQATAALAFGATARFQDGTEALPGLAAATDTDTGWWHSSANTLTGVVGGGGTFRLLSSGMVRLSNSGGLDLFPAPITNNLQIHGVNAGAGVAMFRASADTSGPVLNFGKSRGTTAADLTVAQLNDIIGQINAYGADGTALQQAGYLRWTVDQTPSSGIVRGAMRVATADAAGTLQTALIVDSLGQVLSANPSGGYGFASGLGMGGTVTQLTSKSTAVTINKMNGQIVTATTSMAANAAATFTVNNSLVGANDHVSVDVVSPSGGKYRVHRTGLAAGSFEISMQNFSGGTLAEAVTIDFRVVRGSVS